MVRNQKTHMKQLQKNFKPMSETKKCFTWCYYLKIL